MHSNETTVRIEISSRDSTVGYWWTISWDKYLELQRQYDPDITQPLTLSFPHTLDSENVACRAFMEYFFSNARIPAIELCEQLVITFTLNLPRREDPCQNQEPLPFPI